MIHRVQASINLQALQANFRIAKIQASNSKMVAVIKANAYGHGLLPVAQALAPEADIFAVTDIVEALQLKAAGFDKPILILQGIIGSDDIKLAAESGFHLVIQSCQQLSLLEEELSKLTHFQPMTFWLKLNSGMGRLGIPREHYPQAYASLQSKPYTEKVIMMTHLANSSLPDSELNVLQIKAFREVQNALTDDHVLSSSLPASSGILSELQTQSDWARPGIMLYGSSPFPYQDKSLRREKFGLGAVMTLQSKIIAIQHLKAGDNVGYCSQFICPKDMSIGIVCIGYADGYPSAAPNGTPVLVNGIRTTITGRVSMDMIAIDLSPIPGANINDTVTLWGNNLSVDEIAFHTGILSYNLTCSINPRVSVIYEN